MVVVSSGIQTHGSRVQCPNRDANLLPYAVGVMVMHRDANLLPTSMLSTDEDEDNVESPGLFEKVRPYLAAN